MSDPLHRIAAALERLAPPPATAPDWTASDAYVWRTDPDGLHPMSRVSAVDLDLLTGIDRARDTLLANTRAFAEGLPANNALLWGARGTGKSSLVKAVHARVAAAHPLLIVELLREDLGSLPRLLAVLGEAPGRRAILFCDDLSFSGEDGDYKALKAVLDGGLAGRPDHVLLYATSNRRHLMPREMIENERAAGIHGTEAIEEKVSLSDRFGLWIGFHPVDQDTYLRMIRAYCDAHGIEIDEPTLRRDAIEWQATRGARSGRVAWQFVTDLAARRGKRI